MHKEKISNNIEEYLEAIYTLKRNDEPVSVKEISDRLKVAPPSVTEMLKKLDEKGFVRYSPYHGAYLTDAGTRIGAHMSRKHRLLERFLHDVLKIGGHDNLHKQACDMEHSLSDEAEVALCQFLGHPSKCPDDGNPIQACDLPFTSCQECLDKRETAVSVGRRGEHLISIADLKEKDTGRVAFIRGDNKVLRRLLDMGLTPNTEIAIIRVAPLDGPVEIAVRGARLALGRAIASDVFVEAVKSSKR